MEGLKRLEHEEYKQMALGMAGIDTSDPADIGSSAEDKEARSMAAKLILDVAGKSGQFPWFETYHDLLDTKMHWRIAVYVAWMSTPKKDRYPKTQELLATQVLGLTSDRVISKWRTQYPDIDMMIAGLQAIPLFEARADVFKALIESASNPSYRSNSDRRLYLEMTGDYVPRSKVDVNDSRKTDGVSEMSEAELREIAARAAKGGDDGQGS